jgi:DNA-binding NarL/FixJ family response regulator
MRTVKLSPQYEETSGSLLRKSLVADHPRLRERLAALALIADGLSAKAVARRLGRHRGIVESWVRCFNRHGLRACLKTCQASQATDHEMDHRHTDHRFTGLG